MSVKSHLLFSPLSIFFFFSDTSLQDSGRAILFISKYQLQLKNFN